MRPEAGKPLGVLNLKAGRTRFDLKRYLPPDDLAFFLRHFWIIRWDLRGQPPYVSETLPHPSVHVVFERGRTVVVGVVSGKFTRVIEGNGCVFGIAFKPGAFYPFIQRDISSFTDSTLNLREAFGIDGDALEDAILSGADDDAMIAAAETFLREHLPEPDANVTYLNHIVNLIIADRTITQVDQVVARCGTSKRTLQRLFRQYVGVSLKWVINRYRLHEAVEQLADGGAVDWAKLALQLGYYDQAHFIKDFKAMVGKSPGEYARSVGVTEQLASACVRKQEADG